MQRIMMKSKIHHATITGADLNYVGSITLDTRLMELADVREYEQVHVLDIDNGARFETYVIPGGPGDVILNGAAARLVQPGDKVIVITYAQYDEAELAGFEPIVVHVDDNNQPTMHYVRDVRFVVDDDSLTIGRPSDVDGVVDLLVLGSGVAGLSATVRARHEGMTVTVLTKGELGWSATQYAQGGVAAALDDDDSPELHGSDTLAAGGGLCDTDAVRLLTSEGPAHVRELEALGAHFDRLDGDGDDDLARAREGGHSVARVLHAGGDATGAEIERALVAAVLGSGAEVRERWLVSDLLVEHGRVVGVRALGPDGPATVRARHVLVATGGAGQCFAVTTNPPLSTGDGIAMAMRAGAVVADLEFMQFHPTALHHPSMPRPLLSEALRGEGAILRDEHGVAFMGDEHPLADLAPRDVVAKAISRRLIDRNLEHLWLDATTIDGFPTRFPTIWSACRAVGLDPTREWLPVAPAAHYLSGGVCTDLDGATTLPGLWACGEAACTGVHGANRLASNSLLEGLVFAARVVEAIRDGRDSHEPTGVLRNISVVSAVAPVVARVEAGVDVRAELQRVMTRDAGVVRDATSLGRAAAALATMTGTDIESANLVTVSTALVQAATARRESRGTHTRADFPAASSRFLGRLAFTGGSEPEFVPIPASAPEPSR